MISKFYLFLSYLKRGLRSSKVRRIPNPRIQKENLYRIIRNTFQGKDLWEGLIPVDNFLKVIFLWACCRSIHHHWNQSGFDRTKLYLCNIYPMSLTVNFLRFNDVLLLFSVISDGWRIVVVLCCKKNTFMLGCTVAFTGRYLGLDIGIIPRILYLKQANEERWLQKFYPKITNLRIMNARITSNE